MPPATSTSPRLPAATTAAPRAQVGSDDADSAGELHDRYEQIGLTPRTGWYVSMVLYAVGGVAAVMLHVIDPKTFNLIFLIFGLIAVAMALLSVAGLHYFPNSTGATHVRLLVGLSIVASGALLVGDVRQAVMMLPFTTVLPPAIYYGVRAAAIYLVLAMILIFTASVTIDAPWALGMAVCSTISVGVVTGSTMIAQARTRRLAVTYRRTAYSDPLTGLANTRALRERLTQLLDRADMSASTMALFAIDLDNFKEVNDTIDHAMGDAVLQAVAEALRAEADSGDLVARRGGDEFSLLVPDPENRDLVETSKRLEAAIALARQAVCPEVTPSGSVAYVCADAGDTPTLILRRADDALHDAKRDFHRHDVSVERVRLAVLDRRSESERAEAEQGSEQHGNTRRTGDGVDERAAWRRLLIGSKSIDRSFWQSVAAMQAIVGVTIGGVLLAGWAPGSNREGVLICCAGLLTGALLSLVASLVPLKHWMLHGSFGATLLLMSLAMHNAGVAGAAYIDTFTIVVVYAFYFFNPIVAVWYLPLITGLYTYSALAGSYPYAVVRSVMFGLIMSSAVALVAKVRSVTSSFNLQNWEISQRDALTGASNVRAMRARLDAAVRRAAAGKTKVALLNIDLDDFKSVNDVFNHSTGDEVLTAVTRAIIENVRVDDLVARRGGDEFVVVSEAADDNDIERVAERVADAIARARIRLCPRLVATASVAWVHWQPGDTGDSIMRRADAALHHRKLLFKHNGLTEAV